MMLYLYVQQNIWIVITLLAGVALMLLFCLTYHAMWSPRGEEAKNETIKAKDFASFFAWMGADTDNPYVRRLHDPYSTCQNEQTTQLVRPICMEKSGTTRTRNCRPLGSG